LSVNFGPARPDEWEAALRLFFSRFNEPEQSERAQRALRMIEQGEVAYDNVLVCREGEAILAAMVAMPMAGAAGLIWPPIAARGADAATAQRLLHFACDQMKRRGCKFVQALLEPADADLDEPLVRCGFAPITTLLYLQNRLRADEPPVAPLPRLACQPYSCNGELFRATLLRTYEGAQDCPELNPLRTAEEIVAGYQSLPGCDLAHWSLAWHDGRAVGVLILNPVPDSPSWELCYVGLVPEARGRGLGSSLTRLAMREAHFRGAVRMTLTVDQRNAPARRMYQRLGFEEFDRRAVYLWIPGTLRRPIG